MSERFYNGVVMILKLVTTPFVRVKVTGIENLPSEGGYIITPNHISQLDPILLGVALRKHVQIKALAKESLFRAPVVGKAMRGMGHIPVHRGTRHAGNALVEAEEALKTGVVIGIYPEGTVPEDTTQLGVFKTGAVRLALTAGVPIIPVGQWGVQQVLPRKPKLSLFFKALFTRPTHNIVIGEPVPSSTVASLSEREQITELNNMLTTRVRKLVTVARGISK